MKMPTTTQVDTNNPDDHACRICGRGVSDAATWWIHVVDGGAMIAPIFAPDDDDDPGDTGWHPIGSGCALSIPKTHRKRWRP